MVEDETARRFRCDDGVDELPSVDAPSAAAGAALTVAAVAGS